MFNIQRNTEQALFLPALKEKKNLNFQNLKSNTLNVASKFNGMFHSKSKNRSSKTHKIITQNYVYVCIYGCE